MSANVPFNAILLGEMQSLRRKPWLLEIGQNRVGPRSGHYPLVDSGQPIDGLELGQLIRATPQGQSLPILLATAHAMEGDRQRMMAASGANPCLEKPIYDPNVLLNKFNQIVEAQSSGQASPCGQ